MGALDGVRVIDLTGGIAGPMAVMVLSDQGADVIKVEPPGGDPLRAYKGSVVWLRGRRSVVLDLDVATDRDRLRALLATADVLVESFAPGVMEGWGLGHASLAAELPALIHCSITAYGRDNSASNRPAYDLLVQARSGQQFEQPGWRDGPIFLYAPLPSLGTSFLALEGIVAALYARELTGRGQWVETSLYHGVHAFNTQLWQNAEHKPPTWWEIPRDPQPQIFECSDGKWVHSMHHSGGRGKDRSVLWSILGIEPPAGMTLQEAAYSPQVRAAFKQHTRQYILEQFWANDLAIAPVRIAHEALDDEQLIANDGVATVVDPDLGEVRQLGITFRLHGAPKATVKGPRPRVGQHTEDVLAEAARLEPRARTARPTRRSLRHALEGIVVLDLGNFLAGPFGPMLLGDLGATVYKLESPEGDQMRPITQPFNGCQRGKLDVVADLKTAEGVEIAHRLMAKADVVHHNMRPGVAERLGVGYDTAKKLNPKVIYCHTTMWGREGPRALWPGFDQLGQSSCGCEYELGGDGNPPVWYRFGMCDQACACQSAIAVLMALYWREKTGEGQLVDTSIQTGGMYYNSDVWVGPAGPFVRPRLDKAQTGIGPLYRLYRTSDGWIAIACCTEPEWVALTNTVDGLSGDHRFATSESRAKNAPALSEHLENAFLSGTAAAWFERLDRGGVPVEIADPTAGYTWYDNPELIKAGLVADYQHPEYGRFRQFGHLVNLSETPGRIGGPPPRLGEHSREVLTTLGYTESEITALGAKGITTWPGIATG